MLPRMVTSANLAIVTGTSSGIGAAVASQLTAAGWDVIGLARRPTPVAHARYEHLSVDLSDLQAASKVIEDRLAPRVANAGGRVTLINNAARTGSLGPLPHVTPAELATTYALNAATPLWLMGFVLRHAPPSAVIRIVNVSSAAAVQPIAGLSVYCSSKASLRMAGMVLAQELDSPGRSEPARDVAILSYEPGVVDTEMQTEARSYSERQFPWVGLFKGFKQGRMLVPAATPAAEIVAFAGSDGGPRFQERRLGDR
jgi:benzil reductase ((S)-benzoin forming)